MKLHSFSPLFTAEPVKLSCKNKLLSVFFCFITILLAAVLTRFLSGASNQPILIASMGASTVILFIVPYSPLAQPWPFVGGQLISALVGITCAQWISDIPLAASIATSGSVALMLLLRCLHPPATATALTPIMSGHAIISLGYSYAIVPIAANVLFILLMAIVINRWLMGYDYPALPKSESLKIMPDALATATQNRGISEQDIQQALEKSEVFLDITVTELSKILVAAELYSFKRLTKQMTCGEIMLENIISFSYGTEVEEAWQLMLKHQLKAVPVLDKAKRVIGIVTRHDFFKFIDMNLYDTLAQRLQSFIRRTPDVTANKPEAIGQIMTPQVMVCAQSCHLAELIRLLIETGHAQIPIVDDEQRLVGMVYQANLIAALYTMQSIHADLS